MPAPGWRGRSAAGPNAHGADAPHVEPNSAAERAPDRTRADQPSPRRAVRERPRPRGAPRPGHLLRRRV